MHWSVNVLVMPKQTDAFPAPRRTYRCTYSLPVEMAHNISRIAKRMGISQSALLATVMQEPIAQLASLVDEIPPQPTGEDVKRLRGKSIDLIKSRVDEALRDLSE